MVGSTPLPDLVHHRLLGFDGMTRVLVCGSRDFTDAALLETCLEEIPRITAIIEGGAAGADRLARQFGQLRGITVETFTAEWGTHASPPVRSATSACWSKDDRTSSWHSLVVQALPTWCGSRRRPARR
jgi:hypothetical protein